MSRIGFYPTPTLPANRGLAWQSLFDDHERNVKPDHHRSKPWGKSYFPGALDVVDTKDAYICVMDCPGLKASDLEISLHGTTLSVKGVFPTGLSFLPEDHKPSDSTLFVAERSPGTFERTLQVPPGLKEEEIKAECNAGILVLTFPKKAQQDERKQVKITTTDQD